MRRNMSSGISRLLFAAISSCRIIARSNLLLRGEVPAAKAASTINRASISYCINIQYYLVHRGHGITVKMAAASIVPRVPSVNEMLKQKHRESAYQSQQRAMSWPLLLRSSGGRKAMPVRWKEKPIMRAVV